MRVSLMKFLVVIDILGGLVAHVFLLASSDFRLLAEFFKVFNDYLVSYGTPASFEFAVIFTNREKHNFLST